MNIRQNNDRCAARQLLGKVLEGGWVVVKEHDRPLESTGGHFSVGYIVQSADGKTKAYLKALDLSEAFEGPNTDTPAVLQIMTQVYLHERDLCRKCLDCRLSHIVNILADGNIVIDPTDRFSKVPYIIFELGDGDIRSYLDISEHFDVAWALRCLHHIATGLKQLHGIDVAHQDLKPSNVIRFRNTYSKLTDLGCASAKTVRSPKDELPIAGDKGYAPLELLYGEKSEDWHSRLVCDLYLLGSMVVFFFARTSMNTLLFSKMNNSHLPKNWGETYRDVIPFVRDAFGLAIEEFSIEVPENFRDGLSIIVRELCEPDPKLRGDPIYKSGWRNPYSLESYVSRFDCLARKAEYVLRKR